jgi:hypothetical protein
MAHYMKRKKKHLWFLRKEDGVYVYARKPAVSKPKAAFLHRMCWQGFYGSFRAKLRVGEAIRIPVGDEIARFTPRPPKRKRQQHSPSLCAAVREAWEELIGQFLQGPPIPKPEPAVVVTWTATDNQPTWLNNASVTTAADTITYRITYSDATGSITDAAMLPVWQPVNRPINQSRST